MLSGGIGRMYFSFKGNINLDGLEDKVVWVELGSFEIKILIFKEVSFGLCCGNSNQLVET